MGYRPDGYSKAALTAERGQPTFGSFIFNTG
jgi:hypothetical protein